MKLPKLYRRVYLEIEWITDTCEGGEHVQRSGIYYVPARLVLDCGVKAWQILDEDFNDPYFEIDDLEYEWHSYDLEYEEWRDNNRHNPQWSRTYRTIREQEEARVRLESWDKLTFKLLF